MVRPSPPPGARAKPFFETFRRGFGERGPPPVHPPLGQRLTRKARHIVVVEGIVLLETAPPPSHLGGGAVSTRRQQSSHPHRGVDPGDRRRPVVPAGQPVRVAARCSGGSSTRENGGDGEEGRSR